MSTTLLLSRATGNFMQPRQASWASQCGFGSNYGIDCLSFALMVNHVHVILRNRLEVVAGWSDEEVARSWWQQLFPLRKNKARHLPFLPKVN